MLPAFVHPVLLTHAFRCGVMQGCLSGSGKMAYVIAQSRAPSTGHGCRWTAVSQSLPWRAQKTGRNPTDRGKQGVKRSLLTDANGLPLSLVVTGENARDIKLVADTLDILQTCRPGRRLHLCLDEDYEAQWLEDYLKSRYYEPHIQLCKEESEAMKNTDFKAHRWVVERIHSWMNRFRRVLTRWEKKVENYEAMLHFACGIIVWNKTLLG
jgi:transposase